MTVTSISSQFHGRETNTFGGGTAPRPALWRWRIDGPISVALLLVTLLVLLHATSPTFFPFVFPDEFEFAWQSKQLHDGRLPYADFFSFLPLGSLTMGSLALHVIGPTIFALRIGTTCWVALATIVAYATFLELSGSRSLALSATLWIPLIFFPYWPLASHHWLAMLPGIGAVGLAAFATRRSKGDYLAGTSGFMAVAAISMIQSDGAAYFASALAVLMLRHIDDEEPSASTRRARRGARRSLAVTIRRMSYAAWHTGETRAGHRDLLGGVPKVGTRISFRSAISFAAGAALATLVTVIHALVIGVAPEAFRSTVLWPLQSYRQSGGFNDLGLNDFLQTAWLRHTMQPANGWVVGLVFLAVILMVLAFAVTDIVRVFRRAPRRTLAGPLIAVVVALIYFAGRTDWNHLVFLGPTLLIVGAASCQRQRVRLATLSAAAAMGVLVSGMGWVSVLGDTDGYLRASADEILRSASLAAVLDRYSALSSPEVPIVALGIHASELYFYHAPKPPPVSWLDKPEHRYNDPIQYDTVAQFLRDQKIPYLIVDEWSAYTADPNMLLSRVLTEDYVPCDVWRDRTVAAQRGSPCPG